MRTVKVDELLGLSAYEGVRDRFRARMIEHKKSRRLLVGPEMSVVFEDHDSVMLQIQEVLRAERISDPTAVRAEVDTYNDLVPPDGALLATMMIETIDPEERERRRRELVGIDKRLWLELGDVKVQGAFAPEGLYPDRVAAVQFVTFPLGARGRELLLDGARKVRFVCDHPRYDHAMELSDTTRRALANDLDPANAETAS